MSGNRSANRGKSNLPGAGLSNFSTWSNSTQFLWFMSLTLNALFTTIGVGVRYLAAAGTECKLNVTRTFGTVENSKRWYIAAIVVYGSLCIVVIAIQVITDVIRLCYTEKEFTYCKICKKCLIHCTSVAGKNLFEHLLINTLTMAAALLYLAGDNYSLLVDLYNDDNSNPDRFEERKDPTIRSILAGTSILLTMVIFVIVQWFKDPIKAEKTKYECDCNKENCCSGKHGKDKDCNEVCCENERCTPECCTNHWKICEKHQRSHKSCTSSNCTVLDAYSTWDSQPAVCQCKGRCCRGHKEEVPLYKFLLSWSPWALVIATFDSLFISVVEQVSHEEEVRNGVICDLHKEVDAAIFFAFIFIVFLVGVVVFAIIQCCRVSRWWKVKSNICGEEYTVCICLLITAIILLSIAYIFIGFIFITFDNNWPWICLAKQNEMVKMAGQICCWVSVGLLAILSISLIIFCLFVAVLIVWEYAEEIGCKRIKSCCTKRMMGIQEGIPLVQKKCIAPRLD